MISLGSIDTLILALAIPMNLRQLQRCVTQPVEQLQLLALTLFDPSKHLGQEQVS